jgi:hypothetical protein
MIYKVDEILSKLENCVKYKKPFSLIRFGDGGIKFIDSILNGNFEQMKSIVEKEGLPYRKVVEIFELWGYHARHADFIDTPEVYFNDTFWSRIKKARKAINEATKIKMTNWKTLYSQSEFDNENYCNPESNYLMIIKRSGYRNLLDIMKGKKIALITARPEVGSLLRDYSVDIIKIVGHYENQYKNSFNKTMDMIKYSANNYDFWMVAAGELGRVYTGTIKECGGRSLDMGFVIDFWYGDDIHPRLQPYMSRNVNNSLELILTKEGKKYEKYI